MAALAARGLTVGAAKVGPDFIDPGYHALATGRPARNLDAWLCGEAAIPGLSARAAADADILIVEGVMGLFDGAGEGAGMFASTAHAAKLLGAPVLLVVDAPPWPPVRRSRSSTRTTWSCSSRRAPRSCRSTR